MSSFVVKSIGNVLNATSLISSKYASKKALGLFASPRKGRYTKAQHDVINSAIFEELQYEHLSIATYRWTGQNKTVLLAHGWESNTARWEYILKDLKSQNYNIIALDAPAHGRSDGKQFNAILYAEFINIVVKRFKPHALIGHSVGGMASVFSLYSYQHPSVKKVVLLGAPAHFTGVFKRYKSMMGYNKRISEGMEHIILDRYGKPSDYFSAANFAAKLSTEGLIVHDKKDRIIPYEDALLFDHKFKSSKLITTQGYGHSLKAASITSDLINFINT